MSKRSKRKRQRKAPNGPAHTQVTKPGQSGDPQKSESGKIAKEIEDLSAKATAGATEQDVNELAATPVPQDIDIAAAWQVVEWMHRGRYVAITLMNSDKVHVEYATLRVPGEIAQLEAPTAPEAISLAFLKMTDKE